MTAKNDFQTSTNSRKEIDMNNRKLVTASVVALMLSVAHSASATIRKCDFNDCSDDAKIAMNVQQLLDRRAELGPPNSIQVQARGHVVYLHGIVDTGLEKWIAESVASQAPNVDRVVNSIVENN
jgi:osmotically-inducible protein OsmY